MLPLFLAACAARVYKLELISLDCFIATTIYNYIRTILALYHYGSAICDRCSDVSKAFLECQHLFSE